MTRTSAYANLLDPPTIAEMGNLELLSQRVVDGFLAGMHRSTQKGGCVEFAEHRAYAHGDELRLLDWRVFGRSDRYYVKQFQEQTNLQVILVLDASGSMGFGLSTTSKFDYARVSAACLARLMLRQRDEVGLAVVNGQTEQFIPPRSTARHLHAMCQALHRAKPTGRTSPADRLRQVAQRLKRRGMIVIISDCFDDLDRMSNALHHLRLRGHELLLLHTMAPEELSFSFRRWSRFQCMEETGFRLDLDPIAVRKRYLKRINEFLDRLQSTCTELNCDYVPVRTDEPLGHTLALYLRKRMARMKS